MWNIFLFISHPVLQYLALATQTYEDDVLWAPQFELLLKQIKLSPPKLNKKLRACPAVITTYLSQKFFLPSLGVKKTPLCHPCSVSHVPSPLQLYSWGLTNSPDQAGSSRVSNHSKNNLEKHMVWICHSCTWKLSSSVFDLKISTNPAGRYQSPNDVTQPILSNSSTAPSYAPYSSQARLFAFSECVFPFPAVPFPHLSYPIHPGCPLSLHGYTWLSFKFSSNTTTSVKCPWLLGVTSIPTLFWRLITNDLLLSSGTDFSPFLVYNQSACVMYTQGQNITVGHSGFRHIPVIPQLSDPRQDI